MASVFTVVQEQKSGDWLVKRNDLTLKSFHRFQDARAFARASLLELGKGSVVVYTPSGRPREKMRLRRADGQMVVHAA